MVGQWIWRSGQNWGICLLLGPADFRNISAPHFPSTEHQENKIQDQGKSRIVPFGIKNRILFEQYFHPSFDSASHVTA
ncbi:hypothetical protein VTK73DRAFT_2134 [Phialemonium thermophilum]|uniref:Ycf15 n=1 Tax=Phialemonium thermophilum TaxID=223376 RepID=A0ABR3X6L5_9PEZI